MELIQHTIDYARPDTPISITGLGDLHVGNAGFDERYFLKQRKQLLDCEAHVVLLGDVIDSIVLNDKRSDTSCIDRRFMGEEDRLIDECYYHALDLLEPFRGKLIGCVEGNHEEAFRKQSQVDLTYRLARDLGCPYLKGGAYVHLLFRRGKASYSRGLYATHGCGGATTYGAKFNKLISLRDLIDADFYFCGHMHDRLTKIIPRLGASKYDNKLTLANHPMAFLATGAYLQTYREGVSGYGERKCYKPVTMGCAVFEIEPESGDIEVRG